MKNIIAFLFTAILAVSVQAQTTKSRADLYTEIDTQLASGQQMSAATLRATLKNISASSYNGLTDGQALTSSAANALYQPISAQLSNLASLSGSNVIYYRNASGSWVAVTVGTGLLFSGGTLSSTSGGGNMSTTVYDINGTGGVDLAESAPWSGITSKPTTLVGYGITDAEPAIAAGTTSQYRRGDETWQTLDKTAAGLANVDNTSDANKPISTATQTALDAKLATSTAASTYAPLASPTFTGTVTIPALSVSGALTIPAAGVADAAIASTIARDSEVTSAVASKQDTLVSGTNIKTINGTTLLGSGDIVISGGGGGARRVVTGTDAATVTPNADTTDVLDLATLSQTTTFANPTGTLSDGQLIELRITSSTSRTISFGANYQWSNDLPAVTSTSGGGLTDVFKFEWHATRAKWFVLAVNKGF